MPPALVTNAAAAAHAARVRAMRQEEEEMTHYSDGELAEFEFKIIRNSVGGFSKPERLRTILAEEAKAGWEFLEKFDNGRIRLKRRIEWRERDGELAWDPYRTEIGIGETRLALFIVAAVLGGFALVGLIAALMAAK
ncbi:MAG TPA: hypothetical protein PKD86_12365 [Gemmatales bacterium]|nr:hypothetical protein [Gemmatales bacterium]HMP60136.1 hypothetical protein [Gemmatales bacterium]